MSNSRKANKASRSSFRDIKRFSSRLDVKRKSAGPWGEGVPTGKDGVGLCGHYDVELDPFGYCRDEDCKRERLIKALQSGEAVKLPPKKGEFEGRIVWMPGVKIRKDK